MKKKQYVSFIIGLSLLLGITSLGTIFALSNQASPLIVQTEFGTIEGMQKDADTYV